MVKGQEKARSATLRTLVFSPQSLNKDKVAEHRANLHTKQTSSVGEITSVITTSGPYAL